MIETPDVSYTYDPYYARVVTMVDGVGTTSYTYKAPATNGAGQVASVDGPLSNDTIAYTYDELGRVVQRTINGSANQVDWTFDALGHVTSEQNLLGDFTYTYDGLTNRLATVTYPNDQTSTYSYFDDQNDHRLQTIHHKYPNTSTLSKFDYTYDTVGNILTWRQQADTTAVLWKYGYDQTDQLISAVKHATDTPETILQRFAYAYDPGGNRTIEQIDDAVTLSAYDNLNRLTSQAPGGPMVVMGSLNEPGTVTISGVPVTVDASNNFRGTVPTTTGTNTFSIVAKDASGNTTTQQYEVDVAGTGKTFTYDANGNLTGDGTRSFEWDARNQLLAASAGILRSEFTYDGIKQRRQVVEKNSGTVVQSVDLLWCDAEVCEDRQSGSVIRQAYENGEQVTGQPQFVFADHVGTVRDVTDSVSNVVARYSYDPWGRRTHVSGNGSTAFGFTGHRVHDVGSLHLALYRAYDPGLGRWISQDPVGLSEGPNLFLYAKNKAVIGFDPFGDRECPKPTCTIAVKGREIDMWIRYVPRLSADVDVTLMLVPNDPEGLARDLEASGFSPRFSDPAFVRQTRVMPFVHVATGMPVDVVLAGSGLEEEFLSRARPADIGGTTVPLIDVGDLIIAKVLAGRPRDIADAAALWRLHQRGLDADRLRQTLQLLEEALGQSAGLTRQCRISHN